MLNKDTFELAINKMHAKAIADQSSFIKLIGRELHTEQEQFGAFPYQTPNGLETLTITYQRYHSDKKATLVEILRGLADEIETKTKEVKNGKD